MQTFLSMVKTLDQVRDQRRPDRVTHIHISTDMLLVEPYAEACPSIVEDQNEGACSHGQSRHVMSLHKTDDEE